MDWLEAALLGGIQGLTEFFPVSSSGHLVMAKEFLGQVDEGIVFEVVVHVGTMLAIVAYYRGRVLELITGTFRRDPVVLAHVGKLALATAPAVVVGLTIKDAVESMFDHAWIVGVALIVTGALLLTTRRTVGTATLDAPSWMHALVIGVAQVFAITPGISRSGTTVAVALMLGIRAAAATEFSFLMGVIAIAGAAVLALPDAAAAPADSLVAYAIGGVVAAVSGFLAIRWFVALLRSQKFHLFAAYCFVVGAGFLAYLALSRS